MSELPSLRSPFCWVWRKRAALSQECPGPYTWGTAPSGRSVGPWAASGTGSAGLRKELADMMLCSWYGLGFAVKRGYGARVKHDPTNRSHPFGSHVR